MADEPELQTHKRVGMSAVEETAQMYMFIFGAIQRSTTEEWLQIELSMAQIKLLFSLGHQGPLTIGQAADSLGVGLPTASHLVEKLVQQGLVERINDETDRRQVYARSVGLGSCHPARWSRCAAAFAP